MKNKSLIKLPAKEPVKLESLNKFVEIPKEIKSKGLAFPKDFKAGVFLDKHGVPKYFLFDSRSLWDLFCVFDEKFEKSVSDKEYVFHNPFGWLIDSIEEHLPLNPKFVAKLKKSIEEAKRFGYVPFEKIKRELGLK